jgi:predicted metal-dependent phosphoesterase TrpH
VLGITDHDTIDGLDAAESATAATGIALVPGVELSTTVERGELHLLGYFIDRTDDAFVTALHDQATARLRRAQQMLETLRELGYAVEPDRVLATADSGSIGRPHIARELVRIGAASSVSDAFDRFLRPGRPGYVPRQALTPEQAVRLVHTNGGIPVLAHPFSTRDPEGTLQRLLPVGLRGIEVFYAAYTEAQRTELADLANRYNLLMTGGSDYHGTADREGRELGTAPVPSAVYDTLIAARTAS